MSEELKEPTMWEKFKLWRELRTRRRLIRVFKKLYADPKSGLTEIVNKAAQDAARQMTMAALDHFHFLHCALCPNVEQLVNHPKFGKLCKGHYDLIKREPTTKKEAQDGQRRKESADSAHENIRENEPAKVA